MHIIALLLSLLSLFACPVMDIQTESPTFEVVEPDWFESTEYLGNANSIASPILRQHHSGGKLVKTSLGLASMAPGLVVLMGMAGITIPVINPNVFSKTIIVFKKKTTHDGPNGEKTLKATCVVTVTSDPQAIERAKKLMQVDGYKTAGKQEVTQYESIADSLGLNKDCLFKFEFAGDKELFPAKMKKFGVFVNPDGKNDRYRVDRNPLAQVLHNAGLNMTYSSKVLKRLQHLNAAADVALDDVVIEMDKDDFEDVRDGDASFEAPWIPEGTRIAVQLRCVNGDTMHKSFAWGSHGPKQVIYTSAHNNKKGLTTKGKTIAFGMVLKGSLQDQLRGKIRSPKIKLGWQQLSLATDLEKHEDFFRRAIISTVWRDYMRYHRALHRAYFADREEGDEIVQPETRMAQFHLQSRALKKAGLSPTLFSHLTAFYANLVHGYALKSWSDYDESSGEFKSRSPLEKTDIEVRGFKGYLMGLTTAVANDPKLSNLICRMLEEKHGEKVTYEPEGYFQIHGNYRLEKHCIDSNALLFWLKKNRMEEVVPSSVLLISEELRKVFSDAGDNFADDLPDKVVKAGINADCDGDEAVASETKGVGPAWVSTKGGKLLLRNEVKDAVEFHRNPVLTTCFVDKKICEFLPFALAEYDADGKFVADLPIAPRLQYAPIKMIEKLNGHDVEFTDSTWTQDHSDEVIERRLNAFSLGLGMIGNFSMRWIASTLNKVAYSIPDELMIDAIQQETKTSSFMKKLKKLVEALRDKALEQQGLTETLCLHLRLDPEKVHELETDHVFDRLNRVKSKMAEKVKNQLVHDWTDPHRVINMRLGAFAELLESNPVLASIHHLIFGIAKKYGEGFDYAEMRKKRALFLSNRKVLGLVQKYSENLIKKFPEQDLNTIQNALYRFCYLSWLNSICAKNPDSVVKDGRIEGVFSDLDIPRDLKVTENGELMCQGMLALYKGGKQSGVLHPKYNDHPRSLAALHVLTKDIKTAKQYDLTEWKGLSEKFLKMSDLEVVDADDLDGIEGLEELLALETTEVTIEDDTLEL